jgi:hypothetical protein
MLGGNKHLKSLQASWTAYQVLTGRRALGTCHLVVHLHYTEETEAQKVQKVPRPHFSNEKNRLVPSAQWILTEMGTILLQVRKMPDLCRTDYKWNILPECFSQFRLQVLFITNTSECFLLNHFHSTPVRGWHEEVGSLQWSQILLSRLSLTLFCEENGHICHEFWAQTDWKGILKFLYSIASAFY